MTKIKASNIESGAIDSSQLAAGSIDGNHLAINSVDSSNIVSGAIDAAHMAINSVDSSNIVSGAIDAGHLASNSVTSAKIATAAVTTAKIANLAIDQQHVGVAKIYGSAIKVGTLDTDRLNVGALPSGVSGVTRAAGNNSTNLATTAYVQGEIDESGSWTPRIAAYNSTGTGNLEVTYSAQGGTWQRIANFAVCNFDLTIATIGTLTSTIIVSIHGLPFTGKSGVSQGGELNLGYSNGPFSGVTHYGIVGHVNLNSSRVNLMYWNTGGSLAYLINTGISTGRMWGTISYPIN